MYTADILVPVASKGGMERIIQYVAEYLRKTDEWNVRVVQLVWEGQSWLRADIPFYPLLEKFGTYGIDELADAYHSFIEKNGCPEIILATGWPVICYIAWAAMQKGENRKAVIVSWLHNPLEKYQEAGVGDESALAYADAHFAISDQIYRKENRFFPGKVYRVNNVVDFPADGDKVYKSREGRRKLYYVGRIEPRKRLDIIIRAFDEDVRSMWELHIVGNTKAERDEIELLIQSADAHDVVFVHGWKQDPWNYVTNADAIVMASEYEGASMVVLEALAHGIGVITTPVGMAPELIQPGSNGYLFACGDVDGLKEILLAMGRGVLPELSCEACTENVRKFKKEEALPDFEEKLRRVLYEYHCEWKKGCVTE